jgi:hypothetical protein
VHLCEHALQGAGRGDGDLVAADADGDKRAEFQKFKSDGSGGGLRQLRSLQGGIGAVSCRQENPLWQKNFR